MSEQTERASAWSVAYKLNDGEEPQIQWRRHRTQEEEDEAAEQGRRLCRIYVDRQHMLLCADFGYAGDRPYMTWMREQMEEREALAKKVEALRASLEDREREVARLVEQRDALEKKAKAPRKRSNRKSKKESPSHE